MTENLYEVLRNLQRHTSDMKILTDYKMATSNTHDIPSSSDPFWDDTIQKTQRNNVLSGFLADIKKIIKVKNNLNDEELKKVQELVLEMTGLAIQAEHDDIGKFLTSLLALGDVETSSCYIDEKKDILKGYLTGIVDFYAKRANTPPHTGDLRRDREISRQIEKSEHSNLKDLLTEVKKGKYGEEIKYDKEFYLKLDRQFKNYSRNSNSYAGM